VLVVVEPLSLVAVKELPSSLTSWSMRSSTCWSSMGAAYPFSEVSITRNSIPALCSRSSRASPIAVAVVS
jgi:hypothetical protein